MIQQVGSQVGTHVEWDLALAIVRDLRGHKVRSHGAHPNDFRQQARSPLCRHSHVHRTQCALPRQTVRLTDSSDSDHGLTDSAVFLTVSPFAAPEACWLDPLARSLTHSLTHSLTLSSRLRFPPVGFIDGDNRWQHLSRCNFLTCYMQQLDFHFFFLFLIFLLY